MVDSRYWADKIAGERKTKQADQKSNNSKVHLKLKEYREKLWSRYNLITALGNGIPSLSSKRIIQNYLWGSKSVEITKEFNVSAAYVSKVLNEHLRKWGWEDSDVYQARLILLTHTLADWFLETYETVPGSTRLRELKAKIKLIGDWDSWEYNDAENLFYNELCKLEKKRKLDDDGFYHKVITAHETKAYFFDLSQFDNQHLLDTASRFQNIWYPSISFKDGRYYLGRPGRPRLIF